MARVPTFDLGKQLPRSVLALPKKYQETPAPRGTPPGFGVDFWKGSERTTVKEYWECQISSQGQPRLRVRTTLDGALLSVHDGALTVNGHVKAVRSDQQQVAEMIEKYAEQSSCKEVLEQLRQAGARLQFMRRQRNRKTKRPPLLQVFWQSMIYAAHLVYTFDARAPGAFADWRTNNVTGDREAQHRLSVEELIRRIDGGKRLDWWADLPQDERGALAMHILREAHDKAQNPPHWEWWAGTMKRSAGWVCRDAFTGWLRPVSVRCWDSSKRSGLKSAVDRFVRPRDIQEDLFLATCDQGAA